MLRLLRRAPPARASTFLSQPPLAPLFAPDAPAGVTLRLLVTYVAMMGFGYNWQVRLFAHLSPSFSVHQCDGLWLQLAGAVQSSARSFVCSALA